MAKLIQYRNLIPQALYFCITTTSDVKAYIVLIHKFHCGFINIARLLANINAADTSDYWPNTVKLWPTTSSYSSFKKSNTHNISE